jgi:hypothetical protein
MRREMEPLGTMSLRLAVASGNLNSRTGPRLSSAINDYDIGDQPSSDPSDKNNQLRIAAGLIK